MPQLPAQLKLLLVEDNPGDAQLVKQYLSESPTPGLDIRVSHEICLAEAIKRLRCISFDAVILDLSLPDSQGLDTLREIRASHPHMAVVVLTGLDDQQIGLVAVKEGAQDYLVKGCLDGATLIRSLRYAVERARLLREVQEAQANIKVLSGLIPICSHCKKIRDDAGFWTQLEAYLHDHSEAQFSHGICPVCVEQYYPQKPAS